MKMMNRDLVNDICNIYKKSYEHFNENLLENIIHDYYTNSNLKNIDLEDKIDIWLECVRMLNG